MAHAVPLAGMPFLGLKGLCEAFPDPRAIWPGVSTPTLLGEKCPKAVAGSGPVPGT